MSEAVDTVSAPSNAFQGETSSTIRLKRWRRLIQGAALATIGQWSFYGIFRCPFIVPYVYCQNCPIITCQGRLFTMVIG